MRNFPMRNDRKDVNRHQIDVYLIPFLTIISHWVIFKILNIFVNINLRHKQENTHT